MIIKKSALDIRKIMKTQRTFLAFILIIFLIIFSNTSHAKDIKPYAKDAVEKGWAYFNKGDLETAFKRFHQATIIDPNFAPGYFGKAYVYSIQNKLDEAIINYRKTIELAEPPFSHAYGNLGLALLMKGYKEEGHKMLLKALEVDPNNGDAHISIAQSYCDQNNNEKAWEHIKIAQGLKVKIAPELLNEMTASCPNN